MSDIYEKALVEKRNVLNELRSQNMTLQELRFFAIYLSKINPKDVSSRIVHFSLKDFRKIMDFGRLNLNQLKESTDRLLCKVVHIPNESGNGGFRSFQLFKECRIDQDEKGNWFIEIDAHDKALPLMFNFKGHFFKYELWNALRLKSPAQLRMYEVLKQYEKLGKREIFVSELRELLGVAPGKYDRWERFRVRILDACQKALKETTDICYTYERGQVGPGGKWISIIFWIKKNTNYIDQLTLQEFIDLQPEPDPSVNPDDVDLPVIDNGYEGRLALWGSACMTPDFKREFTKPEVAELAELLVTVPEHLLPLATEPYDIRVFHYLSQQYAKLNRIASTTGVKDRFLYLRSMIERDTK